MAQTTKPPIFDTIDLEREIEEEFRKRPQERVSHECLAPLTALIVLI